MSMRGLSTWTIVVLSVTRYYYPGHSFINFYNIARQNTFVTCIYRPTTIYYLRDCILSCLNSTKPATRKMGVVLWQFITPFCNFHYYPHARKIPPISYWKPDVFIASFPFSISRYDISPNLEGEFFFNHTRNGYILINMND